jgi:hypothetical protein
VVLASVVAALRPDARVHAIDPHEGQVGALDDVVEQTPPTLAAFERNLAQAGLRHVVTTIQKRSHEVAWSEPIGFLFVDGLHDRESVARDFGHFEPWLADGAYVAFHDYAPHAPGVQAFVDEIVASGPYERLHLAGGMILVRRRRAEGRRSRLRRIAANRARSLAHAGLAVRCPLCRWRFRRLRDGAVCWRCGSHPRHRAAWLLLEAEAGLLAGTRTLVHLAPVWCLEHRLRRRKGLRYVGAPALPDLPDGSVDAVLALEPGSKDAGGIARLLAPGGWALLAGEGVDGLRCERRDVAAGHGVTSADVLTLCRRD